MAIRSTATRNSGQHAVLYRMDMGVHVCPYGLKAKDLLERHGFTVVDHRLDSREQVDSFKARHEVSSTPQVFIDDRRIGGFEALQRHLGKTVAVADATGYQPVVAIFGVAALMALAFSWASVDTVMTMRSVEWFVAISMCLLGMQKLQDIDSFSTMFLSYDLLARRYVRYGYLYPFAETTAGMLMIAGTLTWLAAPLMLFIGAVGALSVFKAVYIDRRELTCACVGGSSRVPLGFVSMTENVMMVAMAVWMLMK